MRLDAMLTQLETAQLVRRAEAVESYSRAIAERMPSRQTLWQILFEQSRLADARGKGAQAKTLRDQARVVVDYISDHIGDEELQGSFLALPDVRARMGSQARRRS